ncbi:MAG: hypothetical protein H3C39_10495 [Flavobacteriia bacterium]|nr:hypothetical protein [Flavobacteriia bacterium]
MKRGIQILTELIRNLKWKAVKTFVSHPLFAFPTVWATIESIQLSEMNFGDNPGGNGLANAYRHAVWNVLTALYCSKISSVEKSLKWTEKITNLHEELFPNDEYNRLMDLHNNKVGRNLFLKAHKSGKKSKQELLEMLIKKSKSAVGLRSETEFQDYRDRLVYYPAAE